MKCIAIVYSKSVYQTSVFSRRFLKQLNLQLQFSNSIIKKSITKKHLGILLAGKMSLRDQEEIISSDDWLSPNNFFMEKHLDYGDIIYDQLFHKWVHQILDMIQHNAAPLAISKAIHNPQKKKKLIINQVLNHVSRKISWIKLCCYCLRLLSKNRNHNPKTIYSIYR